MTDKELQEIKARVNNTTATPWVYENIGNTCIINSENIYVGETAIEEDAEFISWARTDVSKLINEIERLRALNRWIPVTERLPEYNKHILLYLKDGEGATAQVVGCLYHSDNKFLKHLSGEYKAFDGDDFSSNFLNKEYVIAWRPLPEPLKEDDNNE